MSKPTDPYDQSIKDAAKSLGFEIPDSVEDMKAQIVAAEKEITRNRAEQIARLRAIRSTMGITAFKAWLEENDFEPEFFWLCGGDDK
jgi:hypothetical protein